MKTKVVGQTKIVAETYTKPALHVAIECNTNVLRALAQDLRNRADMLILRGETVDFRSAVEAILSELGYDE